MDGMSVGANGDEVRCAILYGSESDEHPAFLHAAEQYFDTVLGVPLENIHLVYGDGTGIRYRDTDLTTFDCLFLRLFDPDMLYAERLPDILHDHGVYTQVASRSLFIASNKFYTIKILGRAGVPVPQSVYMLSTGEAERAGNALGYPLVVKLSSGYGGQGVMRVQDPEDLAALVDTLTLFDQDICLQEYVENPGEDIRIVVIGDDTYSYKRVGGDEEWRSNVAVGGHMERFDAPETMRRTALQAARVSGLDICGVDIIEETDSDRFVIGEINTAPSLEGDEKRVGTDLYDRVMAYMYGKTVSGDDTTV